jgi:hypothetical protein
MRELQDKYIYFCRSLAARKSYQTFSNDSQYFLCLPQHKVLPQSLTVRPALNEASSLRSEALHNVSHVMCSDGEERKCVMKSVSIFH